MDYVIEQIDCTLISNKKFTALVMASVRKYLFTEDYAKIYTELKLVRAKQLKYSGQS